MPDSQPIVEEMQVYYGRRAPVYDASMGYDDPSIVARLHPVMDSLRRQLSNRAVVEIACGPGFWTRAISSAVATVTGLDYNRSTIDEARRKPLDWRRVSLVVGDAYRLPFAARTFEGAVAIDWLAHVPAGRVDRFLDSVHAVVRPGGRVVFCDQLPGPTSFTGVFDDEGNHLQERVLPDGSCHRVIKHFRSDEEFRRLFSSHSECVDIESFPDCRRVVAAYTLLG
jgi:ubiquinone/menaquinone biosynthesis C-methylase UbiE